MGETRFHVVLQATSSSHQIGGIVKERPDSVKLSDNVTGVANILRVQYVARISGYLTDDPSVSQDLEEIDISELWPGHKSSCIEKQDECLTMIDTEWTSDGEERHWCLA